MKTFLTLILFFILCFSSHAQSECGTIDEDPNLGNPVGSPQYASYEKSIDWGRSFFVNFVFFLSPNLNSPNFINVYTNSAQQHLDYLNETFEPIGIDFLSCGVSFVFDDVLKTTSSTGSNSAYDPYINHRAINIFLPQDITNAGGFSPLFFRADETNPVEKRRFFVKASAAIDVTIHEAGHFFGLYHTHRGHQHDNGQDAAFRELVDGSNCSTHGDELCDTPADPKLNKPGYLSNCVYVGNAVDANGDSYSPIEEMFMSYSGSGCRSIFSQDQYGYMYDRIYNYTYNQMLPVPHATCELNTTSGYQMNNNYIHQNGYPANCFIPYMDQPNQDPKTFYSYYVVSNMELESNNEIDFLGIKQVQLNPGFKVSAENNNTFKAHIGFDCIRYAYPHNWYIVDNNFRTAGTSSNNKGSFYQKRKLVVDKAREKTRALSIAPTVAIQPNPNKGSFSISVTNEGGDLTILSLDGKVVFNKANFSKEEVVNLLDVPHGVYFVLYSSPEQVLTSEKVIIN